MNVERFWAKVDKTSNDCWEWTAGLFSSGYGAFAVDRKNKLAHRVAYLLVKGEIPDGLQLDHLCRNKRCVNPSHLEPVTAQENTIRAIRKDHCPKGHKYSGTNLRLSKEGWFRCRECENSSKRARRRTQCA